MDLHNLWRHGLSEEQAAAMPFHARPKAHMLQHLVEDTIVMFGSPNQFWCYADEDFVGAIKSVCTMSKHPRTLESRVAEKSMITAAVAEYRLVFDL